MTKNKKGNVNYLKNLKNKSSLPLLIWSIVSIIVSIILFLAAKYIFIIGSVIYTYGISLIILINLLIIAFDSKNKCMILGSAFLFLLTYNFLLPVFIGVSLGILLSCVYIVYILIRKIKHLDVKRYSIHLCYMTIFILLFNALLFIFSSEVYAISMKTFFYFKRNKFEAYVQSEDVKNLENENKISRKQDTKLAKLNTQCVIKYNEKDPTIILFVLSKDLFSTRGIIYTDSNSIEGIENYLNDEPASFKFIDNWYYIEADIEYSCNTQ